MSNFQPKYELALFAGGGGGILGGHLLGWRCVGAVEIEDYPRRILLARQRDGILPWFPIWDDIKTFSAENPQCQEFFQWLRRIRKQLVITGGFPCQGISSAGDGLGLDDPRSGLWFELARVVCEIEPEWLLVENSPMLTVRGIGDILRGLATMGRNARWGVFQAADAIWLNGYPQFDHERARIFIASPHANGLRQLQSQGCESDQRGRIGNGIKKTSYSLRIGRRQMEQSISLGSEAKRSILEIANSIAAPRWGWWHAEPDVGRMVHGLAHRVDRIRATGNGQVPAVVQLAWETLSK